ncbi:MAG: hypothetical protein QG635_1901 [Bacteroidota bacterium]|nr:hypothetical protein [Bacteroidota bacterium]
MKLILALLFMVLFAQNLFATTQTPDTLIFKGKKYALFTNPLEIYFEKYPI